MEEKKNKPTVRVIEFKGTDMNDLEIVDHGQQPWDHVIGQLTKDEEPTQFEIINAIPNGFPLELFDDNELAMKVGRWFLDKYHPSREGLSRLALYNDDMIGAVYEIDQDSIDWEKDHVKEVMTKGTRICSFDSVLTSNDTREI